MYSFVSIVSISNKLRLVESLFIHAKVLWDESKRLAFENVLLPEYQSNEIENCLASFSDMFPRGGGTP